MASVQGSAAIRARDGFASAGAIPRTGPSFRLDKTRVHAQCNQARFGLREIALTRDEKLRAALDCLLPKMTLVKSSIVCR